MIKIFLVEDEIVIREGIKNKINWEEHGFSFVGEASDGELAYPLIQKHKPDVLITDIKMPFMDGLQLSRLVKKEFPHIKIIILSGYNEFGYAKEAIGIGVTEYLLKPVSSGKIIETILKIKTTILEERERNVFIEQFDKEMQERKSFHSKRFLYNLLTKKMSITEILDTAKELNIDLVAEGLNVILFNYFKEDNLYNEYFEDLIETEKRILDYFKNKSEVILFSRDFEGWVLLVKETGTISMEELTKKYADALVNMMTQNSKVDYFVGVGRSVKRLTELTRSFDEASRAFAYRYILNKNQIVFFEDIASMKVHTGNPISVQMLSSSKIDKNMVEIFLKSGTGEGIRLFVDAYLEMIGTDNLSSYLFRQYIIMDVHLTVQSFLRYLGLEEEILLEYYGDIDINIFMLNSKTKEYLIQTLTTALMLRDMSTGKKYSAILKKAKEFILNHFANSDVSLNSVALAVNISPTYFSSIFRQEMGKTFVEYLTNIRMDKAKELLRCTKMRSSEIAYAIGYNDPHYFSYLFKKLEKKTPSEYRAGKADSV